MVVAILMWITSNKRDNYWNQPLSLLPNHNLTYWINVATITMVVITITRMSFSWLISNPMHALLCICSLSQQVLQCRRWAAKTLGRRHQRLRGVRVVLQVPAERRGRSWARRSTRAARSAGLGEDERGQGLRRASASMRCGGGARLDRDLFVWGGGDRSVDRTCDFGPTLLLGSPRDIKHHIVGES